MASEKPTLMTETAEISSQQDPARADSSHDHASDLNHEVFVSEKPLKDSPALEAGLASSKEQPQPENAHHHDGQDYTVFTSTQRKWLVLVSQMGGLMSPLTGAIYYPAISIMATSLNVTNNEINLTVTSFLVVNSLAPMMIAGFSDELGRRPAYVVCIVIFIAANLGLGLQNSYAALLVLRMLQAGGSSGMIALGQGVFADVVTSSERGKYIFYMVMPAIIGPGVGPVIGGVLTRYLGWHSVFWFLLILIVVFAVPLVLFLPETNRNVVADGSIPPPKLNQNLTDRIRHANRAKRGLYPDQELQTALRSNLHFRIPSPLKTLVVLTKFETLLILIAAGLSIMPLYIISTDASQAFGRVYGYNEVMVSFMLLALGGSAFFSACTTGRFMDWNYRRHAHKLNLPVTKNRQMDLTHFPIEKSRLEYSIPAFTICAAGTIGYGWLMDATPETRVSIGGPVALLIVVGWSCSAGFSPLCALILDVYPGQPTTVAAANNLVRGAIAATVTALIGPMTAAWGRGFGYTFWGLFMLAYVPVMLLVSARGMEWRRKAAERRRKRRETTC